MAQNLINSRQLACIMFTDIVGYTALMGEDEKKALEVLKINRKIQKPIIENFGGSWIKEMGDGVLATFSSVTNAVQAAAEIQLQTSQQINHELRIGLHLSEVLFEDGDVFGDGVNIAARIQSLAAVGGIVISEPVQKNLDNKKGIETRYLSEETLKNVKNPIRLFEVLITDEFERTYTAPFEWKKPAPDKSLEKSIAVLPFRNLSKEPEQEYFGDGIAEEIIVTLSGIDHLKVVGRRSSFQFKETNLPAAQIGEMLKVNLLLEGSVLKRGDKMRIYTELIDIKDGSQLWAEKYDRELTDIFIIQDDIATNIAQKLKLQFFSEENRSKPVNMEAYEMLLKGRFYVEKFIEGFDKAMACFTRAIEIDPQYGEAYCELAKLHFLLTMQLLHDPAEGFERAKFYAQKALSINKELGAAHYLLGQIYFWHDWDFAKSIQAYEQAELCKDSFYFTGVIIDPWYPGFALGDFDTAIRSIFKVLETDPLSFYAQLHLGYFYTFSRQKEKALDVFNKMLAIAPGFSEAHRLIAYNHILANENEAALAHAQKAATLSHGMGWAQNTLIIALAKNGRKEEALQLAEAYEKQDGPLHVSPAGIGLIYSYLGDMDKAFNYFQKAIDSRDIWVVPYKFSPEFDHVRSDERFAKLVAQINYPVN